MTRIANERRTTRRTQSHRIALLSSDVIRWLRIPHSVNPHHDCSHSFCPQPDGLSPHRRRPHRSFQLALRAPARRAVHPPHRRHRPRPQRGRGAPADPRRLQVARPRLGRGAGDGRAARAVLPVAETPPLPGGGAATRSTRGSRTGTTRRRRRRRPRSRRPRRRSGRTSTAASGWPRPTPTASGSRPRGGKGR